jgi:G patch domain/KOW motif-containing protein
VHIGKDADLNSYDRVSIDNFGKNVMYKLGWEEGKGVGRNNKADIVKPIEYIMRPTRLGLGAKPSL